MENRSRERVEAFYAAVNTSDLERLQTLIAPDAVFHVGGDSPISGDHSGHEEIFALAFRALSETDGTFRTELLESISNGPYSAAQRERLCRDHLRFSGRDAHGHS